MRMPIPDDWNGEDWRCIQLQWPDSPLWVALLVGLLTMPSRGRFWDERTGNIREVQGIAEQIFTANFPLVGCADDSGIPDGGGMPSPNQINSICHIIEEGMEIMSLCGYNPKAFKIENGSLWVRDFCGEWNEIGPLTTAASEAPTDNPYVGTTEEPEAWSACGKASALIDAFVALSDAAWENYQNPALIEAAMRAAVPLATLSRTRIYQWIPSLIAMDTLVNQGAFNDADMVQLAKCIAVGNVANTSEATLAEVDGICNALGAACQQTWGTIPEVYWRSYWDFIQETIGDNDSKFIMSLGASNITADCDCPIDEIPPDLTSRLQFTGVSGDTCDGGIAIPPELIVVSNGGRRIDVEWQATAGAWRGCDEFSFGLTGGEDGDTFVVRVWGTYANQAGAVAPVVPTKEWMGTINGMRDPTLWFDATCNGEVLSTAVISPDANPGYKAREYTHTGGGVPLTLMCPGRVYTPLGTDIWFGYALEIVQLNDTQFIPSYTPPDGGQ